MMVLRVIVMKKIHCLLCQRLLEIKDSKKGKPYVCCDNCGMQMFVRFEKGIERLFELSERGIAFLDQFVLCTQCDVAVKRVKRKIREPFLGKPGLYCPECDNFLLDPPRDWKGN